MEPNRSYPLDGVFNFRDIGGYAGHDGRTVRWRQVFRSDSVHRVDPAALPSLGVRTVIDLRRPREVARDGRVVDYPGLSYQHIHPEHPEWTAAGPDETIDRFIADRYRELADIGTAGIAAALKVIADPTAGPVVVHCVAGKDRTGVVCALTLSLLGVADDDVAADYALSTAASQRFSAWLRAALPDAEVPPTPFMASPATAMLLFLAELRDRHGSIEGYATHAGLTTDDLAALRSHLLTDGDRAA
ncbi:Protein tyrosine/serine phosphatase [Asanoa hainanensis]|uniref:Protein tyrosine/serine phosphatase n=1 Tax=Asanoa hainanensis TaxID=560556 RepID=A0A239PG00_9ACTN|nr:tyrosine-protein phosphatase [Asanoa hainanensis]SNT65319.1 Protein tyrosine/serine phosphatase [Asanoa hainanensis]